MFKITLRAARVNKGMSQGEVAVEVNKSVDTVQKYEEDSTNIPHAFLLELLDLYDVPDEHIFLGKESVKTGFRKRLYQRKTV
ncbi:helix-turn-helix domain-containing protein [Paenibacillus graminis]|uniref:helix-turn-helix domain-containing protein n=1 Tax=Paenibacillus graminis TaxID=189425 RepID=UPI00046FD4DF|nr:helix-turn-helix transcriptional regulator [Paenibacillus graminis]